MGFSSYRYRFGMLGLCAAAVLATIFLYAEDAGAQATDDFIVRQFVGSDVTPPSVPGNLTATPVATTQIDLAWDASSDNYLMGGYQIWRDDVFLATTTGTTYADIGLTASTTYTYYLYAFDSFFNYSASTTPVSTTTLPIPPPTPTTTPTTTPEEGTEGSRIPPHREQLNTLEVVPGKDSVVIRYETKSHIRPVIRWGRTSSYELGSIAGSTFGTRHETKITGLTPGTTYYFTIEGENRIGRSGTIHRGTFVTLPPDDVFPPGNVRGLTAVVDGDDILLSWRNPGDTDFAKVRIIRSDRFYPADVLDGWPVYEGRGESFRDAGALTEGVTQYYTVFTYDELGNISSGAVIAVGPEGETEPPISPGENELSLSFEDVRFTQDGILMPAQGGRVTIDGAKQLTISIPYERLPEHLKTILVTIRDAEASGRSFSFLLRADAARTFYTGTLAPFGRSGTFPVTVSVFDYKTAQVGYADGTIAARIASTRNVPAGFIEYFGMLGLSFWYTLIFIILLIALMVLGHRVLAREA